MPQNNQTLLEKTVADQWQTLPSGLTVIVRPMPGYFSTHVIFATRFGSIDRDFRLDGKEVHLPAGVAHFLEHKMFEDQDGDAFAKYAKTGKALEKGFMTGDILLNLDSEDEGEIFMGCAGGKDTQAVFHYEPRDTNPNMQYFKIEVKGLNGGHSGGEIHKGLGNANKILVRYLYLLKNQADFNLCFIHGGNLRNAIAREAQATIGLYPEEKEAARILLNHFTADIENELKHVDPNVQITMASTDRPDKYISDYDAEKLILALHACPHGVIGMSHDIEGLVETSTNLASVKMGDDSTIIVGTSQRSSIESCKNMIANQVASVFKLAGAQVTHGDGYPGWAPNPDSKILKVAQETYKRLFNKDAKIMAIHAGLECGLFLEKYPNLDMISFGPTLRDVHSPNERIQIDTVGLWWSHLLELLKNIPAK